MLLALASSVVLWTRPLYRTAALLQIAFYVLALTAWLLPRVRAAAKPLSLAYYFCLVNLASLVGCIKCWRGELSGTWNPPRQGA